MWACNALSGSIVHPRLLDTAFCSSHRNDPTPERKHSGRGFLPALITPVFWTRPKCENFLGG
jgi:hypothetical protein